MRIIAGRAKGARLASPKDSHVRPTSDRMRESLFNILAHGLEGFALEGIRVLDLFAGTGALGFEALSRGADYVLFIEDNAASRGLIRENAEHLVMNGHSKIWRRDATKLGRAGNMPPFGLVFLDPPYGQGLGELALNSAIDGGWLKPGAIIVFEDSAEAEAVMPAAISELDRRVQGDSQMVIGRYEEAAIPPQLNQTEQSGRQADGD